MSRTDNTRPWWIRAIDPGTRQACFYHGCGYRWRGHVECDAHLPPPRNEQEYRGRNCTMSLSHSFLSVPPGWYITSRWYAPERLRERTELRNAARAYNAGDALEDFDFANYHHRHGAAWDWC